MQLLVLFVAGRGLGRVYPDGTGYDLPNGDILIPDMSFVRADRELPVMERGIQPIAPDLAVEIVSPSNSDIDIIERIDSYLSSGTRLVWVIYPKRRGVSVYHANTDGKVTYIALGDTYMLTGEDVLLEFETPVGIIFPVL
jgi:Uma2 family endonuclease